MKRALSFFCLLFALAPPAIAEKKLTVLIWEEYIAPEVVSRFEELHKVKIEQITFDEESDIVPLLNEHRQSVDIFVGNTHTMKTLQTQGRMVRLDREALSNAARIHNRWQTDSNFVVPYMWGTMGIAWRADKLPQAPANWGAMFALAEKQPGKVALLSDPGEHLLAAHFAMGNRKDFTSPEEVTAAGQFLKQRRHLFRFIESDLTESGPLVTGEVIAGQLWNGDVAYLRSNFQPALNYMVPDQGCMIWQDTFGISVDSDNPELAHQFLNYLNNSKVAAENAAYIGYASSNPMALMEADRDYLNDPIIRPSFEGLDHCDFYHAYPAEIQGEIMKWNQS